MMMMMMTMMMFQGLPASWRLSRVNESYTMSPTYPSIIGVPASVTDEALLRVANFRSKGRLPGVDVMMMMMMMMMMILHLCNACIFSAVVGQQQERGEHLSLQSAQGGCCQQAQCG